MYDPIESQQPRSLRKALALIASAVVAGSFFSPAGVAIAADTGTGRIVGRLTSESGQPVPGDVVAVDESTGRSYRATARSDGGYSISGVPAGRYAVLFRPAEAAFPEAPYGYVDAWFPNARRGGDAARVIVDAGAETPAVDSSLTAAGRVSGVLAGAGGDFAVALLDEPTPVDPFDGDTLVVQTDESGRFSLRAPAGGYELLVYRRSGHEWQPYAVAGARIEVASRDAVEVSPVNTPAAGAVELVLRHPDGTRAVEADVTLTRQGTARVERDGLTDTAGRVAFDALAPGVYTVAIDGVERTPPMSVTVSADRTTRIDEFAAS